MVRESTYSSVSSSGEIYDTKRFNENDGKDRKDIGDKVNKENRWHYYNFWRKVDIRSDNECWNWIAGVISLNGDGYGSYSLKHDRTIQAHRMAYILSKGPIPDGLWVLHTCNNGLCCNPNHLKIGTPTENSQYMVKCGRNGNKKLTEDQIREIHKLAKDMKKVSGRRKRHETIAKMFGISRTYISNIVTGKTWRYIYDEFNANKK